MKYAVVAIVLLHLGCSPEQDDRSVLGSTTQPSSIDNGLNFNSLVFNRTSLVLLSDRAMSFGRDAEGRILFDSVGGLETTPEGLEVLRYAAQCALEPGEVLYVDLPSGEDPQFEGLFGLAPQWETERIDKVSRELVSACLLAHVNAFGVEILISVRHRGLNIADHEKQSHPVYEGTFFGDLFDSMSEIYACSGSAEHIANAQSRDREFRVCTEDSPKCEIPSLGRCRDFCSDYSDEYGWQQCHVNGVTYSDTISVFLKDEDFTPNRTCLPGRTCRFDSAGENAIYNCGDSDACEAYCTQGSYCTINGSDARRIDVATLSSTSEINCQRTGDCVTVCSAGSDCEIDCWGARSCDRHTCYDGASCLVDCTGAGTCGFASCQTGVTFCDNDVIVCNRPCP